MNAIEQSWREYAAQTMPQNQRDLSIGRCVFYAGATAVARIVKEAPTKEAALETLMAAIQEHVAEFE